MITPRLSISLLAALAFCVMPTTANNEFNAPNVNVDVTGSNVAVDVIVQTVDNAPKAVSVAPPGHAIAKGNPCIYWTLDPLPDEYAAWDGACNAAGYATGYGRLSYVYPSGAPTSYLLIVEGVFVDGRLHGLGQSTSLDRSSFQGIYRQGLRTDGIYSFGNGQCAALQNNKVVGSRYDCR